MAYKLSIFAFTDRESILQDEKLSLKERGLLAYLIFSRRSNEIFDAISLSNELPEGRNQISGALKGLRHKGYITFFVRKQQ